MNSDEEVSRIDDFFPTLISYIASSAGSPQTSLEVAQILLTITAAALTSLMIVFAFGAAWDIGLKDQSQV